MDGWMVVMAILRIAIDQNQKRVKIKSPRENICLIVHTSQNVKSKFTNVRLRSSQPFYIHTDVRLIRNMDLKRAGRNSGGLRNMYLKMFDGNSGE